MKDTNIFEHENFNTIKKLMPLHMKDWKFQENQNQNKTYSNFYNSNLFTFPFTKPISKIINLENAPMESK